MEPDFIFTIFYGLPRLGPGGAEYTKKAYSLLGDLPENPAILDIGCGNGAQTLALASLSSGNVCAMDIHRPYLSELSVRAELEGLGDRIHPIAASMDALPICRKFVDLVWSEGAVYFMGFREGLDYWKGFVREGGYIAVTELSWFTTDPSGEAAAFFEAEYPAMKTVEQNREIIQSLGLEDAGAFSLPDSAWWDEYYLPLGTRVEAMKQEYAGDGEAMAILDMASTEIEIFRKYSREYGYEFYLMRKK